MRDAVSCSISPVNGGESINGECFVYLLPEIDIRRIPEIAIIVNEHVEIMKCHYPYLKRLYFSDVAKMKEELKVDILVGEKFIRQFQKGETIREGPNHTFAIYTALGWVLSGPLKGRYLALVSFQLQSNRICYFWKRR